jgi:hypothetical protein
VHRLYILNRDYYVLLVITCYFNKSIHFLTHFDYAKKGQGNHFMTTSTLTRYRTEINYSHNMPFAIERVFWHPRQEGGVAPLFIWRVPIIGGRPIGNSWKLIGILCKTFCCNVWFNLTCPRTAVPLVFPHKRSALFFQISIFDSAKSSFCFRKNHHLEN